MDKATMIALMAASIYPATEVKYPIDKRVEESVKRAEEIWQEVLSVGP